MPLSKDFLHLNAILPPFLLPSLCWNLWIHVSRELCQGWADYLTFSDFSFLIYNQDNNSPLLLSCCKI